MGQSRYKKKTGKARRLVGDILRKRRRSRQEGGKGFIDSSSLMIAKELVLINDAHRLLFLVEFMSGRHLNPWGVTNGDRRYNN
jgi:hypothetical protein